MPQKTIKLALADALENLSQQNLEKFRHRLLDRRDEPRVRRNRVEGKSYLDLTDTLVSTFTETGALQVAVEILKGIGCNEEADELGQEAGGQSLKPASSGGQEAGGQSLKPASSGEKHFVDKHKVELIQRVGNIACILDELFDEDVLDGECYDKIRALPTSQEKMRELYRHPLNAGGEASKDVFYACLQKHEKYLFNELSRKK